MEWIIIGAVVVIILSAAIGTWASYDIPKADGDELAENNCAQCERDRTWYESQAGWYQALIFAWWLANRAGCALKGC